MNLWAIRCLGAAGAIWLAFGPQIANASEVPRTAIAPAKSAMPLQLAVQFELKIRLPEGQGLARSLLDIGIDGNDASLAARLAAGHMGAGAGGCEVRISISKAAQGNGFHIERLMLLTRIAQTVIERRVGELTIASEAPAPVNRLLV